MFTPGKSKTKGQLLFEVQLNLLPDARCILTASDVKGTIYASTSPVFGGREHNWSPEHLLLCAVSSCFLTTYQFFTKAFTILSLECDCIGTVRRKDGRCRFSKIDMFPKIELSQQADVSAAKQALERTQQYCLVANSLNCELVYHSQVFYGR